MSIVRIDYQESLFDRLWELLTEAFPTAERPTQEVLIERLKDPKCFCQFMFEPQNDARDPENPKYFCPDGVFIGYQFDDFTFGEYLAIRKEKRNRGRGTELMLEWKEQTEKPLLFEAELPETEIAERRLNFYASLGFHFYDRPYLMPAQREGEEPIPMQLLGGAGIMNAEQLEKAIQQVYTTVYRYVIGLKANADLVKNMRQNDFSVTNIQKVINP